MKKSERYFLINGIKYSNHAKLNGQKVILLVIFERENKVYYRLPENKNHLEEKLYNIELTQIVESTYIM